MLEKNKKVFILTIGTNEDGVDLDETAVLLEQLCNVELKAKVHVSAIEDFSAYSDIEKDDLIRIYNSIQAELKIQGVLY